jgi:Tfp pilus assembly protein PilX
MNNHTTDPRTGERGTALIVSMLLMMTLSMIGASLMFLAQTETASSISYRTMSQARYGAESGAHKAANYLLNTYSLALPGSAGDPLTAYDMTASPVKAVANGNPVILSSNPNVTSNYPVPAVQTAFLNAVQGTLAAGGVNVAYNASAKLLSMIPIQTYAGLSTVVQTWEITADGTIGGVHTATVEVISTLEQQIVPAISNAAFATGGGCGALTFGGNESIDSYVVDPVTHMPVFSTSGGNVGTNGNMTLSGQATINGTLSTPRTGVGTCANGNVNALTESGQATVTGGLVQLPQTVVLATPAPPNPLPPTTTTSFTKNSGCDGAANCTVKNDATTSFNDVVTLTGGTTAATAVSLGNVKVATQGTLHLKGGPTSGETRYYNFNSIDVGSQSAIVIDGPGIVVVNIAGVGESTPIDFSSGSVSNTTGLNPGTFQVVYGGTGAIKLTGGADTAMVIYAPNASASFPSSNATYYGSIIANTISSNGAQIHYDRNLANDFFTSGNSMMTSFTWKKY